MGILGSLKNLVYESDPNEQSESKTVETKSVGTSSPTTVATSTITPSYVPAPAVVGAGIADKKFVEFFNAMLAEANIPGPDYYEFKQKLDSTTAIVGAGIAENTRFLMVFSTMLTDGNGFTKEHLLETAQKYVTFLSEKHGESVEEFNEKRQKEIGTRETKLAELKKSSDEKIEMINKLNTEIQSNQEQIIAVQGEIATENSKIDQNFNNFEASYNQVVSSITQDIEKIKNYITQS